MCIVVSIACSRACRDTMHLSHASRRSNREQRRPAFPRGDTPIFKANYPATQARFQQKQLQEKEQKLLQLYDQQQQRAYQVVQRGSAGSNSSNHGRTATTTTTTTASHTTSTSQGGKVRQMFDERRQTTVKGIDRSYPLEPLENRLRKQANTNGVVTQRNGNVTVNRQSVKRVTRADFNSNVNGGKPVVSYHEEIARDSFGPSVRRHDDEDEYGVENRVATFANGHYRHEIDNEQEEAFDQDMIERNRMMAKIHLMGFDETLKHRVRNDLESEEFPEYLMVDDKPDKLTKRNVTKKLSQAEERLERFKNANAKRSNVPKQSTSSTVIRKRSEQGTKSNSRITKSPSPDLTATKQRETNARATRGSAPSSPSKSPEVAPRRTESRNQESKPSRRSTVGKGADSTGNKFDTTDGVVLQNGSPSESTRKSFVIDFDDRPSKEDDAMPLKKSSMKNKSSNDKQQTASSVSGRPTSSSNSSFNLVQDSSAKGRMAESERGKGTGKGGGKSKGKGTEKPSSSSGKLANASSFNENTTTDMKGLVRCKTCGRSFAQNRIDLHEEICVKTATKKRKQFDPVMCRVKGTELEPFVKKGLAKRETKTKKSETKPDWRRKHEEFISAIRYARETQARLAAGENLSDLPPPPPSDTSDYVQCEHCGRKFNRSAAERHIPICKRMHDKKQTQAPRARR